MLATPTVELERPGAPYDGPSWSEIMARDAYSGPTWWVVNTKNGGDSYTRDYLSSVHFRFLVYRPLVLLTRVVRGSVRNEVKSFLPRYLFVLNDGRGASVIRNAPGVANIVQRGRELITVRQDVIDKIREREDERGFVKEFDERPPEPVNKEFKRGESVRVVNGRGETMWDGLFVKMNGERRSVLFAEVLVKVFGRSVKMTVPVNQIEASRSEMDLCTRGRNG